MTEENKPEDYNPTYAGGEKISPQEYLTNIKRIEAIKKAFKKKKHNTPINNLESSWLAAEPDYTDLQNEFIEQNFSKVFELFNSGIRLGNISTSKTRALEYDLVTAGEALALGYTELALSIYFDVATVVEISQGVKGFRTKMMNTITQELRQKQEKSSKNVFGKTKEED